MFKRSVKIVVDLGAITENYSLAKIHSNNQNVFAVVKADAYGHGAVAVAKALHNADGFAVVSLGEAKELRVASVSQPILVLQGPANEAELDEFLKLRLWPVIHSKHQLEWFNRNSSTKQLQPWLKVDSGMGRLGFNLDDAEQLLRNNELNWFGALTHFASADEPTSDTTTMQIQAFRSLVENHDLQLSMANSAGVLAWPAAKADWSRPGIMLYGSNPVNYATQKITEQHSVELQAAMRVTAPIMSIKHYQKGATIGYAETYSCPEAMPVAYAAIGYGDGLPRVLDRSATVWINGASCSIVGRVSMDSVAIDIRGAEKTQVGDEVVLWGTEHPVERMAAAANTIAYELFTSIRGDRQYVQS